MHGTRHPWQIVLILGLLLGLLGSAQAIPAGEMTTWLTATQAYLRQEYATAHAGFARLLQAELTPTEQAELLWQDAQCLRKLDRPAEAVARVERLLQVAPDSAYLLQGRPFLYQYYLSINAPEKAEALWRDALPHVQRTPYVWELLTPRLVATAQTDPAQVNILAELIVEAKPSPATLTMAVYRPLLAVRRMTEAQALHKRLQVLFAAKDQALAERDQQAYDDALTRNIIEELMSGCRDALNNGDLEAARIWMDHINTMIPEYPQAAEMRALYTAKVKALRKD